jgi:hypothetical protein
MNTEEWTIATYATHNEAMRVVEDRFQNERDRRYTEVNIEKEKALKIKETADLAALSLARESQTYKEQQNDALRDKNLSESGVYATNASVSQAIGNLESKIETALQPLVNFVASQKGVQKGAELTISKIYGAIAAASALAYILLSITN